MDILVVGPHDGFAADLAVAWAPHAMVRTSELRPPEGSRFDLLVVDAVHGAAAVRDLARDSGGAEVVVVAGEDHRDVALALLREGTIADVVFWPAGPDELAARVAVAERRCASRSHGSRLRASLLERLTDGVASAVDFAGALRLVMSCVAEAVSCTSALAWTRGIQDCDDETVTCAASSLGAAVPLHAACDRLPVHEAFPLGFAGPWSRVPARAEAIGGKRAEAAASAGLGEAFLFPVRLDGRVAFVLEAYRLASGESPGGNGADVDDAVLDAVAGALEAAAPRLELRRVECCLRRLAALAQLTPESLVVLAPAADGSFEVEWANEAFYSRPWPCASLGHDRIVGHPDLTDLVALAQRDERPVTCERTCASKDPSCACVQVVTVLPGAGPRRVLLSMRDNRDRRATEERAERLERSLTASLLEWRATFDAVASPLVVLDGDGRVRRLNRAAQRMSGRTYSANIGVLVTDLGPGEPWTTGAELVRRVGETHRPLDRAARDEDRGISWELVATPLDRPRTGGPPTEPRILLVAHDVSRIMQLEESVRQSETMATMGAIVGGVAHEVRNPLFGISATLDAFDLRFKDESLRAYTQVLRTEIGRLQALMGDLLEYGRPAALQRTLGSIVEPMRLAVHRCAPASQAAGVDVVLQAPPDLPRVPFDQERMAQVFTNLLENAVQHSPRGATVNMTAGIEAGSVRCELRDEGPGFPNGATRRVFEPFFTRRRGGTGLGLSIVQRIIERHGGTIQVANGPTRGAVVTVRLPLAPAGGAP